MSNSLQPHGPQHARPPCPSPTPGVYPNSCPSSQWCHLAISSSVVPFSSGPQSFPASGSFPMVSSSHQAAKVLEFHLQHQSFQWMFQIKGHNTIYALQSTRVILRGKGPFPDSRCYNNFDNYPHHFCLLFYCFYCVSHSVAFNSCDPMDCRLPGFSVHGILQARILEWVAISFSVCFYNVNIK